MIGSFFTSFNLGHNVTVGDLRAMCDELKIKYNEDQWF